MTRQGSMSTARLPLVGEPVGGGRRSRTQDTRERPLAKSKPIPIAAVRGTLRSRRSIAQDAFPTPAAMYLGVKATPAVSPHMSR